MEPNAKNSCRALGIDIGAATAKIVAVDGAMNAPSWPVGKSSSPDYKRRCS
ncbi:MAG: hypothetical protein ACK4WK_00730 [Anaerolineae bacterium]